MELSLTSKRTTLKTAQKYCAADIVFDNTGTAYVGDVTLSEDGNIDVAQSDEEMLKFTVTCNVMYLW